MPKDYLKSIVQIGYIFHFPPSEMNSWTVEMFNFWADRASEIWATLYQK